MAARKAAAITTASTGNGAAAWGARLARADYVPAFPITPQTEIIEALGGWIDNGEMAARMVAMKAATDAAGDMIKLLTRLYDPTEGQVLLDGVDLREYDLPSLHQRFGVIFQDFKLLPERSVYENVAIALEIDGQAVEVVEGRP